MKTGTWGVARKKRSYIEVWIFLLMLFSVNFFDIIPVTNVVGTNGSFTFYLVSLFLMFTFNRRAWISDSLKWLVPLWWLVFGIVLSFIPALVQYGQSFGQSFLTNRRMFELAAFPILIAMRPTEQELRSSLYAFSIVYLFLSVFISFVAPEWVPHDETRNFIESGDYVHTLYGIRIVFFAYIFAFHRATRLPNSKNIAWVVFQFFVLFIAQNRTSLIAAVVLAAYVLYTMRMNSNKLIIIAFLILSVLLLVVYTASQWNVLYMETVDQISNPEYNRNKSILYMLAPRDWLRYLLGDGFISANVNPILHYLQDSGIYHTDVGLLGYWHQYGVIPTLTVLVLTIKGLFRKQSFLVRGAAIYVLVGAITLSYFALSETLLWLSIYMYLYFSADLPRFQEQIVVHRRIPGWRYRSISNL